MKYDEFRAMNSDIVVAAEGADAEVIAHGFAQVRELIARSEQRFTRFSETSELVELNHSAGTWFQASDKMYEVINEAHKLAMVTGGLFNPAILPALKRLGYNRSMDDIRKDDSQENLVENANYEAEINQDFRQIRLDPLRKLVYLPGEMQIDLGGIAKGWIAEQAAQRLAKYSEACAVSAGGDMFLVNLPRGQDDWEVGLENPLKPEEDLAVLRVPPGAVATSSIVKRQWKHNGRVQHHLIDPRSGRSAETDWLSVTVWAEQSVEAEVFAKALLIAGPRSADELIGHYSKLTYLAVDKTGWVHGSKNYHEVFHV
ncbi:MAG: FAD:protein FMN transferase [Anaerolineales bacterium]|nr:MAG: FAD:protein FMN transferase [Anaerolineales bacterium]